MTSRPWGRIRALFDQALERDPADRGRFLEEVCGEDETLRSEVESLLEALVREEGLFERPALEHVPLSADRYAYTERQVGPYRLLRELGRGGMGTVHEAVRADRQYHKRVAIKLIHPGREGRRIFRRFRAERQILAGLEHPNIARLLDGGVTDEGRPYFAMEYVEGERLDRFCDRRRLSVAERVSLFRSVCDAVHHAHRNLVVHRDLKPANILVTADGTVKLLDFGIAKVLRAGQPAAATLTVEAANALTPEYASPEQVLGGNVGTASDTFSLGVILYELLTGRHPFRAEGRTLPRTLRALCEEDPHRPSDACSAEFATRTREGSPARLRPRLRGDLDAIVEKAMRKEPSARYGSTEQFSEDLRRYLDGHPVVARRGTSAYRARKFVLRHRAAVAAAAVAAVALVVAAAVATSHARQADAARTVAEARLGDVRELATTILFDVHDVVQELPGATAARSLIVERGTEYLERLAEQSGDDPSLQREVAEAYLRLGRIRGRPSGASLGDLAAAVESYERALALASAAVRADSGARTARRTLALAHEELGDALAFAGGMPEGLRHARAALDAYAGLAAERPDSVSAALSEVISRIKLADLLGNPSFPNAGDTEGARAEYARALALLDVPPLREADEPRVRRYRGVLHERIGTMLRVAGHYGEALEQLERALEVRLLLAERNPAGIDLLRDVAVSHQTVCGAHVALGDTEAALSHCREALESYGRLRALDPENAQAAADLALGHRALAEVRVARCEPGPARSHLAEAVSLRDALLGADDTNLTHRRELEADLERLDALGRAEAC